MKPAIRLLNIAFYSLLTIVVVVGLALHGIVFWLTSDSGNEWVKKQIAAASAESGYTITLGDLGLSFMGVDISTLTIQGEDGLDLTIENAVLRLNPFPLTFKILNISLNADRVTLKNFPEGQEQQEDDEQAAFALPDIFFNTINLSADVEALTLPDNDMVISIEIDQSLAQNADNSLTMKGHNIVSIAGQDLLPDSIENDIVINNSGVVLNTLRLQHSAYNMQAAGTYQWDDQTADITLNGETKLLEQLLNPDLGKLVFAGNLQGEVSDMTGDLSFETTFKEEPLRLTADIIMTDERVTLENINGLSNDLSVAGNITLPFESALAQGTLEFTTSTPSHLLSLVNIDQDIKGTMTADVRLLPKNGNQAITMDGILSDIAWQGMTISYATIKAGLDNIAEASIPDITLNVNNLRYDTTVIRIASGTVSITPEGQYIIVLNANGDNINPFTFNADAAIESLSPLAVSVSKATLGMNGGTIALQGRLNEESISATIEGRRIDPQTIPFIGLPDIPLVIDAIDVNIAQRPNAPVINGNFKVRSTSDNTPALTIDGKMGYQSGRASFSASGSGEEIETLSVNAALPMQLSLYPFDFDLSDSADIDGRLNAALDIAIAKSLMPDSEFDIGGTLQANADLGGTLNTIKIDGNAEIANGRLYDPISDLTLRDINGNARFTRDQIRIVKMTATGADERGRLQIDGLIGLENLTQPEIDINLEAQNMHILSGPPYDVWLNADINFLTEGEDYLVNGDLSLGEVIVQLPENRPESIPQLNIVEPENEQQRPFLERIRLDLGFRADDKIFIRGYGVDTEMAGNLRVTGTANDPQVNGDLKSIRGRYEDFGRQFDLEQAILRFQGSIPPSPYLDIIAAVRVDDVLAKVNIGGTPASPRITFTSTPALPEDEVLSHILFGEDISQISPFQAIQLANTLRRLSGRGGGPNLNILGGIREATGLDDLRIEGSGENTRVGAGKYIADDVYLDVSKGAGEESGTARIEVELTPSVSVESKVGQTGESDSNIFWRWDY